MYESIAKNLGLTKRQLLGEFKKRHAYCLDDEMKVVDDIKEGVFVDYASIATEIEDAYDAEYPEEARFAEI